MTVPDAIVACHVGGDLTWYENVVGRDAVLGMGEGDISDGCAPIFAEFHRCADGRSRLRSETAGAEPSRSIDEVLLREADPESLHIPFECFCVIRNGEGGGRRIHRVMPCDCLQNYCGIFHSFRKSADGIERACHTHHAVAACSAVGHTHSYAATVSGGLADGTAGIGAKRKEAHIGCNSCTRATGRSSGYTGRIMRIAGDAVAACLCTCAHGELIGVHFTEADRACGAEMLRRC